MHKRSLHRAWFLPLIATLCLPGRVCIAQQPVEHSAQQSPQESIARTSATMVQVAGAVDLNHGEMLLGNGSTVTAQSQPVMIALTRGGTLRLCSTTSLHLAEDRSLAGPASTALMMALDRGALEANYAAGKYSDVLLTPDLRILISGPGEAALSIRVNAQGDTCVDNHGINAPYVTVTSQLDGGLYRVLPDQRVTFEHGSLDEVVDHEMEPCGCPAAPLVSMASTGVSSENPAQPGQPAGGPSSTPADTAFPLAVSEGLAPPPVPASKPVVPTGEAHAEVTVPLMYNGEDPQATLSSPTGTKIAAQNTVPPAPPPLDRTVPEATSANGASPAGDASGSSGSHAAAQGFFHRIGHFFSRIFGT
jgi:hypothetical protein